MAFGLLLVGLLITGCGLLMVVTPKIYAEWDKAIKNHISNIDRWVLKHHVSSGLILMGIGLFCIVNSYYLVKILE